MVDWRPEDADLYLPRNLSHESNSRGRLSCQLFDVLSCRRRCRMQEEEGSFFGEEKRQDERPAAQHRQPLGLYLTELNHSDCETEFSEDYTAMTASLPNGDSSASSLSSFSASAENGGEGSVVGSVGSEPPGELKLPWPDTPSCSVSTSPDSPPPPTTTFFEDREFDFLRTETVKRSTSLKTYKTPPGTPGRKKAVRFADALGLDLESVRHILNLNEPPKVPASATRDLKPEEDECETRVASGVKHLSANFPQPGASATFFQRVAAQKVLLENCLLEGMAVSGTVRVANLAYHKKVVVRYSVNNWLTSTDVQASYVQNSNDGPTDRFAFALSVPPYFSVGSRLQFCLQFTSGGEEFWDSNYGGNYVIECYAKSGGPSDNNWMHFV